MNLLRVTAICVICVSANKLIEPHFHAWTWALACIAGIAIGNLRASSSERGSQ